MLVPWLGACLTRVATPCFFRWCSSASWLLVFASIQCPPRPLPSSGGSPTCSSTLASALWFPFGPSACSEVLRAPMGCIIWDTNNMRTSAAVVHCLMQVAPSTHQSPTMFWSNSEMHRTILGKKLTEPMTKTKREPRFIQRVSKKKEINRHRITHAVFIVLCLPST